MSDFSEKIKELRELAHEREMDEEETVTDKKALAAKLKQSVDVQRTYNLTIGSLKAVMKNLDKLLMAAGDIFGDSIKDVIERISTDIGKLVAKLQDIKPQKK